MARREWLLRHQCATDGCAESATFSFPTKRDMLQSWEAKHYGVTRGVWKCVRHSKPEEVLSAENLETHAEVVSEQRTHGVYWGQFGMLYGLGFKAYAKDFPPGTKLIVTARIELPNPPTTNQA